MEAMADSIKQSLQLRVIELFAFMMSKREDQLKIIEHSIGERKNLTQLDVPQLRKVIYDITGEEVTE